MYTTHTFLGDQCKGTKGASLKVSTQWQGKATMQTTELKSSLELITKETTDSMSNVFIVL